MQTISWNEVWPCHSDELHELRFLITLQKQPNTDQNHSRTISPADFPRSRLRFPAFLASDVAHPEGCSQGDTSAVSESLKAPPNRFSPQRLDGFTLEMLHLLRRNSQRTLNAAAHTPSEVEVQTLFPSFNKNELHPQRRQGWWRGCWHTWGFAVYHFLKFPRFVSEYRKHGCLTTGWHHTNTDRLTVLPAHRALQYK